MFGMYTMYMMHMIEFTNISVLYPDLLEVTRERHVQEDLLRTMHI